MQQDSENWPKKVYYYGKPQSLPERKLLHAGRLHMIYEKGNLRKFKVGNIEVLRMIYSAVRDQNWETLDCALTREQIVEKEDGFRISYRAVFGQPAVFQADFKIIADIHEKVEISMKGEMLKDFYKNRIGFCILHPIKECAGNNCTIIHSNGFIENGLFPFYISPHQPFLDIRAMRWITRENVQAELLFEGDIFEMEDQRNWTDASYKTYCTPLEVPFPVMMQKGQKIFQKVTFRLLEEQETQSEVTDEKVLLKIDPAKPLLKLPALGLCRSPSTFILKQDELKDLKRLKLDHYRVDIRLNETNWEQELKTGARESELLHLSLELCVHLSLDYLVEFKKLPEILDQIKVHITYITLIDLIQKATPGELIKKVVPFIRTSLPEVKVGAGTDAYFAELNRTRLNFDRIDYINYSVNPQVHAFDNLSLVENIAAQGYTVFSARRFSGNSAVHVSPVTLKKRFNPDATSVTEHKNPDILPDNIDSRQMSLFNLAWTLGSLQSLSQAGTDLITYFETTGMAGIMQGNLPLSHLRLFYSFPGAYFPVYALFYDIALYKQLRLQTLEISDPELISAMALSDGNRQVLLLANLCNKQQQVIITGFFFKEIIEVRTINENNVNHFMHQPFDILDTYNKEKMDYDKLKILLMPYSYMVISNDK